jgi:hypothetical protein
LGCIYARKIKGEDGIATGDYPLSLKPNVSGKGSISLTAGGRINADINRSKGERRNGSFFARRSPKDPKIQWRQWALVKGGQCFLIVSSIREENEERRFKDVNMMESFEVTE